MPANDARNATAPGIAFASRKLPRDGYQIRTRWSGGRYNASVALG